MLRDTSAKSGIIDTIMSVVVITVMIALGAMIYASVQPTMIDSSYGSVTDENITTTVSWALGTGAQSFTTTPVVNGSVTVSNTSGTDYARGTDYEYNTTHIYSVVNTTIPNSTSVDVDYKYTTQATTAINDINGSVWDSFGMLPIILIVIVAVSILGAVMMLAIKRRD